MSGRISKGQTAGSRNGGTVGGRNNVPGRGRKGGSAAALSDASVDGRVSDPDPEAAARAIVLRQLTNSPKSRHQLAAKLAEREIPADVASAVLDRFEEVQLVDDAEFARVFVRSRAATRSLARSALRRELAGKGVRGDIAEDALAQLTDDDESAAARQLVEKKLRSAAVPEDRQARDKLVRRLAALLARKGYGPGLAFSVVNSVLSGAADGCEVNGDGQWPE